MVTLYGAGPDPGASFCVTAVWWMCYSVYAVCGQSVSLPFLLSWVTNLIFLNIVHYVSVGSAQIFFGIKKKKKKKIVISVIHAETGLENLCNRQASNKWHKPRHETGSCYCYYTAGLPCADRDFSSGYSAWQQLFIKFCCPGYPISPKPWRQAIGLNSPDWLTGATTPSTPHSSFIPPPFRPKVCRPNCNKQG